MDNSSIDVDTKILFRVKVSDVVWDCPADVVRENDLPRSLTALVYAFDRDSLFNGELSDFLSDEYGFCIYSYDVDSVEVEPRVEGDEAIAEILEWWPWNESGLCKYYEMDDGEEEEYCD